jgi:hypothetical protein
LILAGAIYNPSKLLDRFNNSFTHRT